MTNPGDKRDHRKYRKRITQKQSFIPDHVYRDDPAQVARESHVYPAGPRVRRTPVQASFTRPKVEHLQAYVVARESGVIVERGVVVVLDNGEWWWGLPQLQSPDIWILMSTPPFNLPPPSGFGSAFSNAFGAGI